MSLKYPHCNYIRKTRSEWQVLVDCGDGWQYQCGDADIRKARELHNFYRVHCKHPSKLKYGRIPIKKEK